MTRLAAVLERAWVVITRRWRLTHVDKCLECARGRWQR